MEIRNKCEADVVSVAMQKTIENYFDCCAECRILARSLQELSLEDFLLHNEGWVGIEALRDYRRSRGESGN